MGRPIAPNELRQHEPCNRLMARDAEFGQIMVGDRVYDQEYDCGQEKGQFPASPSVCSGAGSRPSHCLLHLGRSLAEIVCTEDFTYMKACEGPPCTLLFVDRTRGLAQVAQHGSLRQSSAANCSPKSALEAAS